ncbi:hypothetical protein M0R19_03295 [Candidatus Pacearchaeota archaeon]|jgi:hypothetical protein|nr:hypothetical protein [Candidatus Pacearchaeota archaeon]
MDYSNVNVRFRYSPCKRLTLAVLRDVESGTFQIGYAFWNKNHDNYNKNIARSVAFGRAERFPIYLEFQELKNGTYKSVKDAFYKTLYEDIDNVPHWFLEEREAYLSNEPATTISEDARN